MTRKHIGDLGVDFARMYLGDPCYVFGQPLGKLSLSEFLRQYDSSTDCDPVMHIGRGVGVVVCTGSDGCFPVYAEIEDGRCLSVTVDFEPPEGLPLFKYGKKRAPRRIKEPADAA